MISEKINKGHLQHFLNGKERKEYSKQDLRSRSGEFIEDYLKLLNLLGYRSQLKLIQEMKRRTEKRFVMIYI